eukprot:3825678-Rhodomonas_salina.2
MAGPPGSEESAISFFGLNGINDRVDLLIWPNVHHIFGAQHHQQSQGMVERTNWEIAKVIAIWIKQHMSLGWLAAIASMQVALNTLTKKNMDDAPGNLMLGKCAAKRMADDFAAVSYEKACERAMQDFTWAYKKKKTAVDEESLYKAAKEGPQL